MSGPVQFSFANSIEAVPQGAVRVGEGEALAETPRQTTPRKPPAPTKSLDVLKLAKARLKEVHKELRRMQKLEKERAELERLIAAAENKPPAVALVLSPKKNSAG